jgi:cold shock CspA family protein
LPTGTVIRYERNSGFGFIRGNDDVEVFVHHTGLVDREFLVAGQVVSYMVEEGERGPRAVNVTVKRDVPLKAQRHLDWRGRRGRAPRPGDPPTRGEAPARTEETELGGEEA